MKKKTSAIAFLLVFCISLLSPLTGTAMAVETTEDNGAAVARAIQQDSCAYVIDENGERTELEFTDIEVTEAQLPARYRGLTNGATAYTVKMETEVGEYNGGGIVATGTLTMTWIDVQGVKNEIDNLSGSWEMAEGTFVSGKVRWGTSYRIPGDAPHSKSVEENFDFSVDYTSTNNTTGRLQANSYGQLESSEREYLLVIEIVPSFLD